MSSSRRIAPSERRGRRRAPAPRPVKRYVLAIAMGVSVFGLSTAFASSLTVTSASLSSGNAAVTSCNASAAVTYNTAYVVAIPGYEVTTAPITSAVACAGKAYKVTLTGAGNASLAERTGTLDGSGNATPDFGTASDISAALVTGVSVVISG